MPKRQTEDVLTESCEGDGACGLARETFLCGQELDSYGQVWAQCHFKWRFPLLLDAVRNRLQSNLTEKAYVFGCSEPQQFNVPSRDGRGPRETKVLPIPAIVVAFCTTPVPEMLGITSVQSSTEAIVPMRNLKMSWVPFDAANRLTENRRMNPSTSGRSASPAALDARIFVLQCTMRDNGRGAYVSEARRKQFEYAMPYLLRSKDLPEEPEEVTHVSVTYTSKKGERIEFGFDKEVDRTQIFIPELIEDYSLDADEFDPVKACLKEAFVSARAAKAEQLAKQRQSLDEMGPTARAALDAMHILKAYPDSEHIDSRVKTTFVNRYYGHAHELI